MLAPIIVFAYNRPNHLRKTLTALCENKEAIESDLYVFIDGPKSDAGNQLYLEVQEVANSFANGFKTASIIVSIQNQGLANSVIHGVTKIIAQYGKAIITEDDAICSRSYLRYMNEALSYYESDPQIWSVGGYTVPLVVPDDYKHDVIFTQRCSSYAWGTWKDRWERIDWRVLDYRRFHWCFVQRLAFNRWGNDRASMLDDQMLGRVNSWAIRFDYAMFKHDMYTVLPRKSQINNIGHDGSGTHFVIQQNNEDSFAVDLSQHTEPFEFCGVIVDRRIRRAFGAFFHTKYRHLFIRYIGNLLREYR